MITNYLANKKLIFDTFKHVLNTVFLFTIICFINNSVNAQVANYNFSETTGIYADLTSPITAVASGWDDTATPNTVPIGFTFGFNATNYTTCSLNSNGYITFGTTTAPAFIYVPISDNTAYSGAIAALGVDLQDASGNPISYQTNGTSPNRVFTVQWKNADRYNYPGSFNFQIQLYETSNLIKIIYGTCAPAGVSTDNIDVQVGLRGANPTDFKNRSLTTDNVVWNNNTSAGTLNTAVCRTQSTNYPNSGLVFVWTPLGLPTIASLGTTSACAGNTITINGTNFAGVTAANIKIGGTAVTAILTNTGTQITATIGTGTTGTVTVNNGVGTATSASSFTVFTSPVINMQPTATSGCAGSSTIVLSVVQTGGTIFQWRRNGVNLTNVAPYSDALTNTLTITNPTIGIAGNFDIIITNAGSCSTTSAAVAVSIIDTPLAATTPTPSNANSGVCYSGTGALTSVSWAATATATSYDVYFSAGSLPGSVTATVATNAYNCGTLLANTTYYWKVVAKNSCGTATGSSTWTFSTLNYICSCIPIHSQSCSGNAIINVIFNTINNNSSCGNVNGVSYTNYALAGTPTTSIYKGSTYNLSVATSGPAIASVWIDYNQNGVYETTEWTQVYTNATSGTISVLVPTTATTGITTVRIRSRNSGNPNGSGDSCSSMGSGETEDYKITINPAITCVAPIVQPTALILSPNGNSIAGSFTLSSPLSDNYLVIINTTGTAPSPVNSTTYTIGGLVGAGNTVVDIDGNNIFLATGLALNTNYYVFVFSYNNNCIGGPLYNLSMPLNGNGTTLGVNYCTPSVSSGNQSPNFINQVNFIGNISNSNNNSSFSSVPIGYQDFTSFGSRATQAQGEGVNIFVNTVGGTNYMKAWVDWNKDGAFDDITEIVYQCSNSFINTTFGFKVPFTAISGNYRLRLRINKYNSVADNTFTSCGNIAKFGETEDYLFTVIDACTAKINTITSNSTCGSGSMTLGAVGSSGTMQYRWYDAEVGGTLVGTSATTSWTTPVISTTIVYFVTAFNGTCESLFRTAVKAVIKQVPTISFANATPIICGENTIIDVQATGSSEQVFLIDENFEAGLGTFTNNNIASPNASKTNWQVQSSPYVPQYPTFPVWYPAISSGITGNKFATSTSDIAGNTTFGVTENALESSVINTSNFTNLTLVFDMYFSSYYDILTPTQEFVIIETKIGSGAWTAVPLTQYSTDIGIGTLFANKVINMSAYVGNTSFQIRVRYKAGWCDGVAIDDIKLFGDRPLSPFFTYSGGVNAFTDAAATMPYTGVPANIVYLKPTLSELELSTFAIIATANLTNGCTTSGTINVTNTSKIWKGTSTTNWNTASNWLPIGIPTAANCVIIPNNTIIPGSGFNAYGKNLTVKATGNLLINSDNNLTITDFVKVEPGGNFTIENNASLIQINNVVNSGTINYKRIAPNILGSDYVYWSSPVAGQNIDNIYSNTSPGIKYLWNTVGANANGGLGNWNDATSAAMTAGQGYIVRGSTNFGLPATNLLTTFSGIPNNGTITIKSKRGDMTTATVPSFYSNAAMSIFDDNWSLLGNPYPSAINGLQFLSQNSTDLVGTLYLWRHLNSPAAIVSPFYQNFTYNYNSSDYLGINFTGPTTPGAADIIKSGQAFMVQRKEGAQDLTGADIVFNNAMRLNAGVPMANNNFYRNIAQTPNTNPATLERHRIWLDVVDDATQLSETTLLGYVAGATNDNDNLFDGPLVLSSNVQIYSVINNENYIIQGRGLPFDTNDQVQLGINAVSSGNYHLAINAVDGLFDSQNIYLEDKLLNITHNLKLAPYNFSSIAGIYNNRFVLKYTNATLANNNFEINNDFSIASANKITLFSNNQNIKKIEVYDLLGRKIDEYKNLNTKNQVLENLTKSNKIYIIKTTFENDSIVSKKVIF